MRKLKMWVLFCMILASQAQAADSGNGVNQNNEHWCDSCGAWIKNTPGDDHLFVQPVSNAGPQSTKACSANSTENCGE